MIKSDHVMKSYTSVERHRIQCSRHIDVKVYQIKFIVWFIGGSASLFIYIVCKSVGGAKQAVI